MTGPNIPTDCILWEAYTNEMGYGRYTRDTYRAYAHRWAYCDNLGIHPSEIEDKVVMHTCDNPSCVNPDHLKLGTTLDNVRDMDSKGRRVSAPHPKGERHPNAKLTDEMVSKIQLEYNGLFGSQKKLSVKYKIPTTTINRIVNKEGRFKYGS